MFLKQSTTVNIKLGPFVDQADGVTPETALTPTVKLSKNASTFAARNSATATVHDADGYYTVELNATDTSTVGNLQVSVVSAAAHLAVLQNYTVLAANIYDSLIGNSDYLFVDILQISGSGTATTLLEAGSKGIVSGAIVGATSTATSFVTNLTEATNTHYVGGVVIMTSGVLAGQRLRITGYTGSTKALTVENRTADIPTAGDTFTIN